jgi:hypothetical protein
MPTWNKEEWDKIFYLDKDYNNYNGPLRIGTHTHLVIDITYSCNMSCINCNRLSNVKNSPKCNLSLEDIKNHMRDWVKNNNPLKSISLTGGEPTVHPEFIEIINLLARYANLFKIYLSLFTNGGKSFLKVKDKIPKNVNIVDSSKTDNYPFHFPFTIAPIDFDLYDPENNPCSESLKCGRTLNKKGYFVCPSAAAIDNFLNLKLGISGFNNTSEENLREHAKEICKYCGTYMREKGIGDYVSGGFFQEQDTSQFWKNKLKL